MVYREKEKGNQDITLEEENLRDKRVPSFNV